MILLKKLLVILLGLILCAATKVYAEDAATVTVAVKDLPQKLQNRTVIVTLGNGPSDTESTVIVLDGLNNYTETVTIAPSEYYCAAAVQYDALGDYPLQEINQTTFLQAEGGSHYDLIYTLAGSSWYESVTGQQRHYRLLPLKVPPENYEPEPAQVGVYLTAPIGFSQHVIVYLQNLYTDDVYDLELYESNGLAAVEPNALSGKYAFLSACVVGDAENRYQFNCEQNELSTENGVDFHLTVTDTANPDREMNTPSRDQNSTVQAANSFNNRNTDAPQQPTAEPEIVSQPVKQQEKQLDLLFLLLDFMPVVLVGAVIGTTLPLTVTQMLWVNLIMDTFAAMALASLPPSRRVMNEKPRKTSDFIITPRMAKHLLFTSLAFVAILLTMLVMIEKDGDISIKSLSMFFTTFVMLQFWNLLNMKAFDSSNLAFHKLLQCRGLLIVLAIIFAGQVIIVEFGGKVFRTCHLNFSVWLQIFLATSLIFLIPEIVKAISRQIKRSMSRK